MLSTAYRVARALTIERALSRPERLLAVIVVALVLGALPFLASAQSSDPPIGSVLRVANTDGQGVNLRQQPSRGAAVVARLEEGSTVVVVGPTRRAEDLTWRNVRDQAGRSGWAAAEYLTVVSTPTPVPTATVAAEADDGAAAAQPTPTAARPTATPRPAAPIDVDARVKYPETDRSQQVLTIVVTRHGEPVAGVLVTAETEDADPPISRELDPTDEEGRTSRTFSIRREKGTVTLRITAVAPDGGKGTATVSYFRR